MNVIRVVATVGVVVAGGVATAGGGFLAFWFGGPIAAVSAIAALGCMTVGAGIAVNEYFARQERAVLITANQAQLAQLAQNAADLATLRGQLQAANDTAAATLANNAAIRAQREVERTERERAQANRAREQTTLVNSQARVTTLQRTCESARSNVGSLRERVEDGTSTTEDTVKDLSEIHDQLMFESDDNLVLNSVPR